MPSERRSRGVAFLAGAALMALAWAAWIAFRTADQPAAETSSAVEPDRGREFVIDDGDDGGGDSRKYRPRKTIPARADNSDNSTLRNPNSPAAQLGLDPIDIPPVPDPGNEESNIGSGVINALSRGAPLVGQTVPLPASALSARCEAVVNSMAPTFVAIGPITGVYGGMPTLWTPTVLVFWTLRDPGCSSLLSTLQQIKSDLGDGVAIAFIDDELDVKQLKGSLAQLNVALPWLSDTSKRISNRYCVPTLPVLFFVDRIGIIREIVSGPGDDQTLWGGLIRIGVTAVHK